ncbi:substance-K receptor-like [Actinia tenebrosa]|uniref:Substance-K receptor-like n=1 Tax=Actinia tenebrosa TaxID=6105 RepID=A0A6P8I634_ACTTE|nr:substance-K receptor-like [Actinia tenebrosa]
MSTNYNISASTATTTTFSSLPENISLSLKNFALVLLLMVSLTGNTLILWAIYEDKRLRTNTNILIANMAVSDLIFPLVSVPTIVVALNFNRKWLIGGDFGVAICKLVHFLGEISFLISIYSCIFIALDRYYAVAHPFKGGFSRSRLKYIIPGIWIFSGLVTSPYLRISRLKKYNDSYSCELDWSQDGIPSGHLIHSISVTVLANGLTIPIIIILYSLIFIGFASKHF